MSAHHPVEELLGVYALHAVDDAERAEIEAHLAECPRCRSEVDAHREVAAHLALSGAPAPDGLWDRIADALEGTPPPPLRLVVDDGNRGPARPRSWRSVGLAVAAVAAAVAIVALSVSSVRQQGTIDDLEQAQGLSAAANQAFAAPDARIAEMATANGEVLVRAVVLPDGTGFLLADALPDLDDRTYQLWGATGDQVVSLGVMGSAPTVLSFPADPAMNQLMITEEDGPVVSSTAPPVVAGPLI